MATSSGTMITETDHSPVIQIFAWLLLIFTLLSVATRLFTKISFKRALMLDDYFIIVATVVELTICAVFLGSSGQGVGQSLSVLSEQQIVHALKVLYAEGILSIIVFCCTKLSILAFAQMITPIKAHTNLIYGLSGSILLWGVTSLLAASFQCRTPNTWDFRSDTCFDRRGFFTYMIIGNIVTDVAVTVLPVFIISPLNTSISKRVAIMSAFGTRIFVIIAACVQLAYLHKTFNETDYLFAQWPYYLSTQIVEGLSVATACFPYLKPVFEKLESGHLRSDDHRRREQTYGSGRGSGYGTGSRRASKFSYVNITNNKETEIPLQQITTQIVSGKS